MMKNTIALVMVLSMAGIASAALQLDVIDSKAVISGNLESDFYVILTAGNGATLSNFALGPESPDASCFIDRASYFRSIGGPIPAGFEGECWLLATFPIEAYKPGTYLTADVTLTTVQETRMWEEHIPGDCWPGAWFIRTWTEVAEIQTGSLSLVTVFETDWQWTVVDELSLSSRTVNSTYIDGPCPEPATLALLGLGMVLIRRKRST